MSREILFKAKRKDWRELPKEQWWVEGEVIHEPYGVVIQYYAEKKRIKVVIDPETLCQYTGLKDKNGKRIWENDIVSCEHEKYPEDNPLEGDLFFPEPIKYRRNYVVEFINNGNKYGYRLRNKSIHFMLTGNVIYNHEIKVLGNIFDNPELLGGAE
ncbi:YopX family protein [Blautia hydrogenotrophica]|jgi:uncharacterized phage protein (TIGR01671 family)|uniref:YopX family protein n=1 Tax=Blautia hydrogenotrophica TaxID=53443 RepID=UPI003AB7B162